MFPYCIVSGCKNNGNIKENGPKRNIRFRLFPTNPVLKARWLKAVGRSDWELPDQPLICNDHYSAFQLNSNFEVCRICLATNDDVTLYSLQQGKLKQYMDTILPINNDSSLPQFVCFECAVHLRKCYNMIKKSQISQEILHKILAENGEITKSLVQSVNRENLDLKSSLEPHNVTPTYLFHYQFNHEKNCSSLTNIEYIYDINEYEIESDTKSDTVSVQTLHNDDVNENFEQESNSVRDHMLSNDNKTDVKNGTDLRYLSDDDNNSSLSTEESVNEIPISADEINKNEKTDANCMIKSISDQVSCNNSEIDLENDDDLVIFYIDDTHSGAELSQESTNGILIGAGKNIINDLKNGEKSVQKSEIKTIRTRKHNTENEDKESVLAKHFNIVYLLTLQEKIDEWNKAMENPSWMKNKANINNVHKCEVCSKLFANVAPYEQHRTYHDPSYGMFECPVCKIRIRSKNTLGKHLSKHSKKYYCKWCPKIFLNSLSATKHYSQHMGREYRCRRCSYSARHPSSLSEHVQRAHPAFACELCGRSCVSRSGLQQHQALRHPGQPPASEGGEVFSCEECNLKFISENALRVHLLTTVQHKDANRVNPALQNACKLCGASFQSTRLLLQHKYTKHTQLYKNGEHSNDKLSLECEYCDASLFSRHEYYWHMRREHPTKVYKAVVEAVCPTCGKGFQSEAKLRQHELRHGSPRERCDLCGRMFFDKFALTTHLSNVHTDVRPYSCDVCARSFNLKGNLARHMLIHTGEKPYDCHICGKKFRQISSRTLHVRTVHLKMPHPPRKKRNTKTRKITTKDSDSIKNTIT